MLDIDGLGKTYVATLAESGDVTDVADLFTLTAEQLTTASGSAKRAAKLADQIEAAKKLHLSRIFCSLGVLGTGRSMSRRIARHFRDMKDIRQAATGVREKSLIRPSCAALRSRSRGTGPWT
ncbi:hypothetical protein [Streptomyces sp. CB00455]|uniref:hypothetical protein n=1 Tax=Streptomyces sp. CB00455 TaxID=1703927 RepID=UPI000A6FA656